MIIVKCVAVLLLSAMGRAVSTVDGVQNICRNGFCGDVSYDELLQTYRGIFFSDKQRREKEEKMWAQRLRGLRHEGLDVHKVMKLPGDGDSCCATLFAHITPNELPNAEGNMRRIVHLRDADDPVHQLIPTGTCVMNYGKCDGQCIMEPLSLNLLVYDDSPAAGWPPVKFDWFEMPGYCSCKNIWD